MDLVGNLHDLPATSPAAVASSAAAPSSCWPVCSGDPLAGVSPAWTWQSQHNANTPQGGLTPSTPAAALAFAFHLPNQQDGQGHGQHQIHQQSQQQLYQQQSHSQQQQQQQVLSPDVTHFQGSMTPGTQPQASMTPGAQFQATMTPGTGLSTPMELATPASVAVSMDMSMSMASGYSNRTVRLTPPPTGHNSPHPASLSPGLSPFQSAKK